MSDTEELPAATTPAICPKCKCGDNIDIIEKVILSTPLAGFDEHGNPVFKDGESAEVDWDTSQPLVERGMYELCCRSCSEIFSAPAPEPVRDRAQEVRHVEMEYARSLEPGTEYNVSYHVQLSFAIGLSLRAGEPIDSEHFRYILAENVKDRVERFHIDDTAEMIEEAWPIAGTEEPA